MRSRNSLLFFLAMQQVAASSDFQQRSALPGWLSFSSMKSFHSFFLSPCRVACPGGMQHCENNSELDRPRPGAIAPPRRNAALFVSNKKQVFWFFVSARFVECCCGSTARTGGAKTYTVFSTVVLQLLLVAIASSNSDSYLT